MAKSHISNYLKKQLKGKNIDLSKDTIKITLKDANKPESGVLNVDADEFQTDLSKVKWRYMFSDGKVYPLPLTRLGKRLTSGKQVMDIAKSGKSIWHTRIGRAVPAAFMQNMQLREVIGYIRMGWLYEYKPMKNGKTKAKKVQKGR